MLIHADQFIGYSWNSYQFFLLLVRKPLRFDVGDTRRLIIEDSLGQILLRNTNFAQSDLQHLSYSKGMNL